MAKKKPLTTAELFYINSKGNVDTPEQIATDLGRNVTEIVEHIPEKKVSAPSVSDHIKRVTKSGSDKRGIAVMTPQASEMSDAIRTTRPTKLNDSFIHRCAGE